MVTLNVSGVLKGPLFAKGITPIVEAAILDELINKAGDRAERGGKGQGAKVNRIRRQRQSRLDLVITSSLRNPSAREQSRRRSPQFNPRVTGSAWTKKNMGYIRAIARRGTPAIARRIISELS